MSKRARTRARKLSRYDHHSQESVTTMATPTAPSNLRRRGQAPPSDSSQARMFLALAIFWPIVVLVFYLLGSEPVASVSNDGITNNTSRVTKAGLNFRKYMDRVDIMGYGPTHPRVAVVVVGDDRAKIISSVESVFR